MSALLLTIRESARYRGRGGHWSWIAHRISGLAILAFLVIHVWETALANYNPPVYEWIILVFKNPIFGIGEILLVGAVLYHAFNGIRISILDFKPELWKFESRSVIIVWTLFIVTYLPVLILMVNSIFKYCGETACWDIPSFPSS